MFHFLKFLRGDTAARLITGVDTGENARAVSPDVSRSQDAMKGKAEGENVRARIGVRN